LERECVVEWVLLVDEGGMMVGIGEMEVLVLREGMIE
jgi:DNA-directed RNA polymerase subunit E'/Rpb7